MRIAIPRTHTYRLCASSQATAARSPIRGARQAPLGILAPLVDTRVARATAKGVGLVVDKVAVWCARAIAQCPYPRLRQRAGSTEARLLRHCGIARVRQRRQPSRIPGALASGGDVNHASTRVHVETLAAATAQAEQQHHLSQQHSSQPPGQPQTSHERCQARPCAAGERDQGARCGTPAEERASADRRRAGI